MSENNTSPATTGEQSPGLSVPSGSPPRRRFRIELVGYGDTKEDALAELESLLSDSYIEGLTNAIRGTGWIKMDEDENALTGDEYRAALKAWRNRLNEDRQRREKLLENTSSTNKERSDAVG